MLIAAILTFAVSSAPSPAALDPELSPPVLLEATGKLIDTEIGHAAPFYGDFDGSGTPSLLVGQYGGGKLWIYKNIGTRAKPVFDTGKLFQAGANTGVVPAG